MDRILDRDVTVRATPAAEGVRFEFGTATATAVRNRRKDLTVRVVQTDHTFRNILERIPLIRGVARLFGAFGALSGAINESARLKPRSAYHGSAFTREFARLFQIRPQSIAAFGSALLIPVILLALFIGMPAMVESVLLHIPGLPRAVVNIVCCMFRMLGALLSVYAICRLRLLNRLCMYRGAASKVLNAYEAYGTGLTHETALLSPRLTDKSDGAFLIVVMLISIVAFACVHTSGLLVQLCTRAGIILAAAAIVNEIVLPLENANPNGRLASIRQPLMELQHLFTIEPHNQMIEVALCAFRAACENDLSDED